MRVFNILAFSSVTISFKIDQSHEVHRNSKNDITSYEFVVFTDPQFGKSDKEGDGDGTDWSMDIENVAKMCSQLNENLAFVMCAGDLVHAQPVDEGQSNAGSLPALRPAQTYDFIKTMELCPASVPQYFIPGNRDIGNVKFKDEALTGFEMQFMPGFYFFQVGQRYFITSGFAKFYDSFFIRSRIHGIEFLRSVPLSDWRLKSTSLTMENRLLSGKNRMIGLSLFSELYLEMQRKLFLCILLFILKILPKYMLLTKASRFDKNTEIIYWNFLITIMSIQYFLVTHISKILISRNSIT